MKENSDSSTVTGTGRANWWDTFQRYQAWNDNNQRIPSVNSSDKNEQFLARWRLMQRVRFTRNQLTREQVSALNKTSFFKKHHDLKWTESLDTLRKFIEKKGRLPVNHSNDASEKQIAAWRHQNFKLLNRGKLLVEKARLFARLLEPELDKNRRKSEQAWENSLKKTLDFVKNNKRFPARNSQNKQETVLFRWRKHQIDMLQKGTILPHRAALLKKSGLHIDILEKTWHDMLKKVVLFKKEYGRLPVNPGSVPNEKSLANWCARHRSLNRRDLLAPNRKALLNAACILEKSSGQNRRWDNSFKRLEEFCIKNNRLPSKTGDALEIVINNWYCAQKIKDNKGILPESRSTLIKYIKSTYRPLGGTNEDKWQAKYHKVNLFIQSNKRLPEGKKRGNSEELLYKWLTRQKAALRNHNLTPNQQKMLKNLLHDFSDLQQWIQTVPSKRAQLWDANYLKVKEIIEKSGHIPHALGTKEERNYRRWFYVQQTKLRKKMLTAQQEKLVKDLLKKNMRRLPVKDEELWIKNLHSVKAFIALHKRFPIKDVSTGKEEKKLANWRSHYGSLLKRGLLSEKRTQLFIEAGLTALK